MKRYDLAYIGSPYLGRIEPVEHLKGEWLQYDDIPRPTPAAIEAARQIMDDPTLEGVVLTCAREILRLAGEVPS